MVLSRGLYFPALPARPRPGGFFLSDARRPRAARTRVPISGGLVGCPGTASPHPGSSCESLGVVRRAPPPAPWGCIERRAPVGSAPMDNSGVRNVRGRMGDEAGRWRSPDGPHLVSGGDDPRGSVPGAAGRCGPGGTGGCLRRFGCRGAPGAGCAGHGRRDRAPSPPSAARPVAEGRKPKVVGHQRL